MQHRDFLPALSLALLFTACSGAKTTNPAAGSPGGGGDAGPVTSAAGFHHPGVLVNGAQLEFVKAQVAAGAEPWTSAMNLAKASPLASLNYVAKPRASVDCGSNSNPDLGCKDEQGDVAAAYTDALIWAIGGDEAYAKKSIEIMNAWSAVLTTHTLSNALVQSGWTGSVFPRAAGDHPLHVRRLAGGRSSASRRC